MVPTILNMHLNNLWVIGIKKLRGDGANHLQGVF
jgi:hypothetical protein